MSTKPKINYKEANFCFRVILTCQLIFQSSIDNRIFEVQLRFCVSRTRSVDWPLADIDVPGVFCLAFNPVLKGIDYGIVCAHGNTPIFIIKLNPISKTVI